jgi:hypothetical protein
VSTGSRGSRPDPHPYPHLPPELRRLTGDALALWADAGERRRALEAIVAAWEAGSPNLAAVVARVDAAVVEGLRALGLPRGPVREVRVDLFGRGWLGRKTPECDLFVDAARMRAFVRNLDEPDTVFRSWVHESLHGRQPYDLRADSADAQWRGYEEGLVEGLADLVTRVKAGMRPGASAYTVFVATYRALAAVANIDVELLWRTLWVFPVGQVRASFVDVVDDLRRARSGRVLTAQHRTRLLALADHLFRSRQAGSGADERVLATLWRSVFR